MTILFNSIFSWLLHIFDPDIVSHNVSNKFLEIFFKYAMRCVGGRFTLLHVHVGQRLRAPSLSLGAPCAPSCRPSPLDFLPWHRI
jgi:hypothetical protein